MPFNIRPLAADAKLTDQSLLDVLDQYESGVAAFPHTRVRVAATEEVVLKGMLGQPEGLRS